MRGAKTDVAAQYQDRLARLFHSEEAIARLHSDDIQRGIPKIVPYQGRAFGTVAVTEDSVGSYRSVWQARRRFAAEFKGDVEEAGRIDALLEALSTFDEHGQLLMVSFFTAKHYYMTLVDIDRPELIYIHISASPLA